MLRAGEAGHIAGIAGYQHLTPVPIARDPWTPTASAMSYTVQFPEGDANSVTALLRRVHDGDPAAVNRLLPLVYDELRATARRALAREQAGHTLHATDLVHEAFFKMVGTDGGAGGAHWQDRAHFFAVASRAMRQVLVEHARRRLADKRGGGAVHVTLGAAAVAHPTGDDELLALDEALDRLGAVEPRLRALVEHRFFAGMSERETAAVLGVSERTAQREWARARAWLYRELYPASASSPPAAR
jgi:RNA polymerase sigma factor (TIGR02999 family)